MKWAFVWHWVRRQERYEVLGDSDGTHSGSPAAVRYAERLMKIQVADVGTDVSRPAQANHRIHVGPVHVHLPTMLVNDGADFGDSLFEHAMR